MMNEYVVAWGIYLLAVLAAQVLCWRVTRPLPWAELRLVVQLCVFTLLITPARLQPEESYWAPAFMAALMDGLNYGSEQALSRLWTIVITTLVLLLVSIAWTLLKSRQKAAGKPAERAR